MCRHKSLYTGLLHGSAWHLHGCGLLIPKAYAPNMLAKWMKHCHIQEKEHPAESPTVIQDLAMSQTCSCGRKAEAMGCWLHPGMRVAM